MVISMKIQYCKKYLSILFLIIFLSFLFSVRGNCEDTLYTNRIQTVIPADALLKFYIQEWLKLTYRINHDKIFVEVDNGEVFLKGFVKNENERKKIIREISKFPGIVKINEKLKIEYNSIDFFDTWLHGLTTSSDKDIIYFARGDLFIPPLADQKQPRFHMTYQHYNTNFGGYNIGSVGFGENFGIARYLGEDKGDGFQVGMSAAVFAIFNLDAESMDLLNADYVVGFPVSLRKKNFSGRLRLYHQSSHLRDEFLLQPQPIIKPERINLSFEAAELLLSMEINNFRFYGGGTRIISSQTPLKRKKIHCGFEFIGNNFKKLSLRPVFGLNLDFWDETDWEKNLSLKTGVRLRSPYSDMRAIYFLIEYFNGHIPHGQFYKMEVDYFGLGITLTF